MINFAEKLNVFIYPVLFIILLFFLVRYLKTFHIEGISKWTMPTAFLIKIAIGLLLFLIHIQTYGIDELSHDGETFLREGKYLNDVFFSSPKHYLQLLSGIGENQELIQKYLFMTEYWSAGDLTLINDSKNVIRVHSIIHFFSGNSVLIHLAVLCLISLVAIRNFFLSFKPFIQQSRSLIFWTTLLVPSTIFWTSSLLKEPLLFFGMSLLARGILYEKNSYKKLFYLFFAIAFLIGFKPYVLVCLIVALISLVIYRYLFKQKLIPSILFMLSFIFLVGILFEKPTNAVVHYLSRKQFDFVNVGKGGLHVLADSNYYYFQPHQYSSLKIEGNSVQLINPIDAFIIKFGSIDKPVPIHLTPKDEVWRMVYFTDGCASYIDTRSIADKPINLLKNTPEALVNSIFRPFPNDPGSNLKFLSFIEIWLLTFIVIFAILKRRILNNYEKGIIFTLVIFALILFLLIGWTTPVLGAITRYRFPAQFALILVSLIILKPIKSFKWKNMFS